MTCTIPSVDIGIVRQRMYSRAKSERIPISAVVEVIATCNFSCQHCYIAPCAEREDVMPLERAEYLFDILQRAGTLSLLLTGGEVLTHKQFREIYLAAKRRGFMVVINTNGYLIGDRWADLFAEWPPELISISIYGLSDERYETVTGIPNAFRRVKRACEMLRDRGIPFELKCPAMSLTVDEIPAMRDFAESLGSRFRYDTVLSPEEKGSVKPLQLQLAPKAVVDLDDRMNPGLSEFREFFENMTPNNGRVYRCGGGRTTIAINVHGGASTCVTSRQVVGNLFEQPFEDVWQTIGGKVEKRFPDGHPCANCRFRSICAGCPATVEQVTGLPEGYVQQYCAITHLRAQRLGAHPTGVPRTVLEGIPAGVVTARDEARRALPVLAYS
jgi:radical SAM protein with 4Fe4S-binding SPASM domain